MKNTAPPSNLEQQLREMNQALLVSSVRQHELSEQAEKANALVRESEERYRTLFDVVPMAVYSCDAAGVIQQFNRHAAELWGREPALGDTDERFCGSFKLFRPDGSFMPHEQCPMAEVVSGKISEARDAEVLIERPDGSRITVVVNIRPLKNQGGEVAGAINCFYDITERKRAEVAVKTSELRYRRLFEAAHDGILILNKETRRIADVNPFMLNLLDFPREHFVGKELWEIGVFRNKQSNQDAMQELHEKGSIRYEDVPLQDRNGRRHPVEVVANVYQEDRHAVIQCNIRDITERVRFERDRAALLASEQASRLEAEAANRAKDVFLATLSHELRTPLNAILGWAVLLGQGKLSGEEFKEAAEAIERCAKDQARLIEDVLDISRIVSGKLRLDVRACQLSDVIEAAIASVAHAAGAKGVRIDHDIEDSASPASADPIRIQQVLWNLLANAVKFTDKGGWIKVGLKRERSVCRITVSDSGWGISADFLPHVFERFRQADSGSRRQHAGLGLGLSIVRHLVEMHGGTVSATSPGPGRGSTFTVELPIRAVRIDEEESGAPSPGAAVGRVRLDGFRLLVVDDEADARRVIKLALERAGATVWAAASVADALNALPKAHPHLLISDLAMPGQDGYDLIHQVRGWGRDTQDEERGLTPRQLPAIALTAYAGKAERQRALMAGFQVHLTKPVDPDELIATVAALAGLSARQ